MSAIIRACGFLTRSFDSGVLHTPTRHAMLEIDQNAALGAAVAARAEYEKLSADLSQARERIWELELDLERERAANANAEQVSDELARARPVLEACALLEEDWLRKCEWSRDMRIVSFARAELARRGES